MYKKLIAVIMPLLCSSPCWSHEDMWVIIWASGKHGSEETGIGTTRAVTAFAMPVIARLLHYLPVFSNEYIDPNIH